MQTSPGFRPDRVGLSLCSAEAAYLAACEAIPRLTLELLRNGDTPGGYAFEIRDARGRLLWEVPFAEVLDRIHKLPRRA
ncbi:hypothetical protein MFUR16E_22915 [Methylobacterium fujisawaense]